MLLIRAPVSVSAAAAAPAACWLLLAGSWDVAGWSCAWSQAGAVDELRREIPK